MSVRRVDVLVVGTGPAGAAAATTIARQGLSTVLVGAGAEPSDGGDHDVVLSAPARRGLASIGALDAVPARAVGALELRLGEQAGRSLPDVELAVCDHRRLVEGLRRVATATGTQVIDGIVAGIERRPDGHQVTVTGTGTGATPADRLHTVDGAVPADPVHIDAGATPAGSVVVEGSDPVGIDVGAAATTTQVIARHVIVTATSTAPPEGTAHTRGRVHAWRFTGVAAGRHAVLLLAPPRTVDPHERPTCVWVLPGQTDDSCTVSVCRIGELTPDDAEAIAHRALCAVSKDGSSGTPVGPAASAVIDTGFTPGRAVRDGALLVGDAAGLVNPFTGESLSYAVDSALLAARAIVEHRDHPEPDAAGRSYSRRLAATFVGYFETARHAARRYHLAWRVLAATADSDRPFFAKARRAMLLPEGLAGLTAIERMDLPGRDALLLEPFLAACDEVAVTTVRREWPFVARLLITADAAPHRRLRPAVPFFAALLSGGRTPAPGHATVGAAIELATLGALAFLGSPTSPSPSMPRVRSVDWGTAAVALTGDFLLAQASRLVAEAAPEASWSFADWLAELTALRAARLVTPPQAPAAAVFAALLEFPARIGAQLGGAAPEVAAAVRDVGHHSGRAFLHAEDVLALRGERTRLDATLEAMVESRISSVPDLLAGRPGRPGDADERSAALAAATAACSEAIDAAHRAAGTIGNATSRRIFQQFAAAVAGPAADVGASAG